MKFSAWRSRAVRAVREYFHRELDAKALMNFDDVAQFIRRHLAAFYSTLLCASVCSTFGSYLYSTGYTRSSITALGTFTSIFFFNYTAPWKKGKRVCALCVGALFGGALVTPWLSWFLFVDPGSVVATLLATSVGFGLFFATNWSHCFLLVYYRALLLSVLLLLCLFLIESSVIGRDTALWRFQLHVLVLWFMVYVSVYSQEVVWKARFDDDYVKHAVSLYTDFPAVVLHVIMMMFRKVVHTRNRRLARNR